MGINITQTLNNFQFENRENLRNTARDILSRQNASEQSMKKIIDKTIFDSDNVKNFSQYSSQLAFVKASSQIAMNEKLKETLKYLKSHSSQKKEKKPVLGELWNLLDTENNSYNEDMDSIVIDYSAKNIFAAA